MVEIMNTSMPALNSNSASESDQKTVLVIDDDINDNEILDDLFSMNNFKTLCALNGKKGVEILTERKKSNKPVDVIILDKTMPVMDGLEFLKQPILEDYSLTPIIILSANITHQETIEANRTGAWDFILKSGNLDIILDRVQVQLDKIKRLKNEVKKQHELKRLAYIDHVTNLPNTKAFFDKYKAINNEIALLIVNLDRFSEINNIHGRPVGDIILKIVADRIRSYLTKDSYIARLGGAEFVIIMNDTNKDNAETAATVLTGAINDTYRIENLNIHTTASIGISFCPEHGKDIATLLKNANVAASKVSAKGNRVLVFDEGMLEKIRQENEIKNDLRYALTKEPGQLKVHFQPVVDHNGKVIGAEALIRWHHPKDGLIPPYKFIPLAEQSEDLIVPLTDFVMETVCNKISEWRKNSLYVSVNISTVDLLSDNFINKLENLINKYNTDRNLLKIEITESHVMEDPEKAFEVIHAIKDKCKLELLIDDFGTGHSALSYLNRFPKGTTIKIDQSFIQSMPLNEEEKLTLYGIINLASTRNMPIIVEGVDGVPIPKNIFTEIEGIDPIHSGYIFDDIKFIGKWNRLSRDFKPYSNTFQLELSIELLDKLGITDDKNKQKLGKDVFEILKRFSAEYIFEKLKSFEIKKFQGFYFAKPLSEEQFETEYLYRKTDDLSP